QGYRKHTGSIRNDFKSGVAGVLVVEDVNENGRPAPKIKRTAFASDKCRYRICRNTDLADRRFRQSSLSDLIRCTLYPESGLWRCTNQRLAKLGLRAEVLDLQCVQDVLGDVRIIEVANDAVPIVSAIENSSEVLDRGTDREVLRVERIKSNHVLRI